jgi:hypothetical protein
MTKNFETQATKTSAASWSKFNLWLNSVTKILDYDLLADTHHNAENTQKEIMELNNRIYELESTKLAT